MSVLSRVLAIILGLLVFPAQALASEPFSAAFTLDQDGRINIQAVISGQSLAMLVDTGLSSTVLLTPATAAQIRPRYIPFLRTAPMRGIDGQGVRGRIAAIRITDLGGASGDWDVAAVVTDVSILKTDAMLGMRFLKDYDATFDFTAQLVDMAEPDRGSILADAYQNCDAGKPAFSLDGDCRTSAVYIDTGGRVTVINRAMATRLGIPDDGSGRPATLRGISGGGLSAQEHDLPVVIGGQRISSVLVADFPGRGGCISPCAEAILGMDVLGKLSALRITPTQIALIP